MVKKKRETKYDPPPKPSDFRGFVNVDVTKEQKEAYHDWADKAGLEHVLSIFARLIDGDYKLSVKPDTYGGGVQASLTCASDLSEDKGLVLTARAPDFDNALMLLAFKHVEILREEWELHYQESATVSEWG